MKKVNRPKKNKSYRNVFLDICNGCSYEESDLGAFYIKHLTYENQVLLEDLKEYFFQHAKERGLPTTEESLENLKQEGLWTQEKEEDLKKEESFLATIIRNKKNTYLKSQIDAFNNQIQTCKTKINRLKNERVSLLGNTCENHADQKVTEEFIKLSFFKDRDCKNLAFSQEEFDELDNDDVADFIDLYNQSLSEFSDLKLQKLVLEDFFSYYMPFCEDPIHFYGKSVIHLTHNQIRLLLYSRYFKNILTYNEDIPEEMRHDPEKILDYVNANEKAKKIKNTEGKASTIVNATKEDYKYLNMDKEKNTSVVDLGEEAKKRGGSLKMKDFMELMEQDK